MATYRVKVFELDPATGKTKEVLGFAVEGANLSLDQAKVQAKTRLREQDGTLVAFSHAATGGFVATLRKKG